MTLAMSVNYSQFALAINIKGLEEKTCTRQTYDTFLAENTQRVDKAKLIPQTILTEKRTAMRPRCLLVFKYSSSANS